jgi:hypothetical protein
MLEAISRDEFERDVGRLDTRTAKGYRWKVIRNDFPTFDVVFEHDTAKPLRLRLHCEDWDEQPPSVEILNEDGTPVTEAPPNQGGVFNPGVHETTGRFFVCMRGAREYHIHSSHTTDHWANYRGQSGMGIVGIVFQLWHAWKKAVG